MAVLSAAGVRRELLHVAGRAGVLASGGRRVEAALVDRVLEWLSDRSLLTFSLDGQTVVMHRLVAQVVRDGLFRRRRLGALCWVAASVLEAHAIAVAGSQDRPGVRGIPQQVTGRAPVSPAERSGRAHFYWTWRRMPAARSEAGMRGTRWRCCVRLVLLRGRVGAAWGHHAGL